MSSHKGSVVAWGNGAPASNRETDMVELAELGPLLQEKDGWVITNPTKAEEVQTCPMPQEKEEKMEEFLYKVWEGHWRAIPYDVDNDYLLHGHRPSMPSFWACFKSIFHIHVKTGIIWTHLLAYLPLLCLCSGHFCHHGGTVGPVSTPKHQQTQQEHS
uniref:Adiponectin receptor 1 n=1 Tax=Rhinopithecus bieti TaxID=61621 RepID=A0A2K6KKT7_RHIBE